MPALPANFEKFSIRRSSDNLGTVRDLAEYDDATDTTSIVDHYVYDAFGNETDHTGSNHFLFKYTGRAFDDETGLQNNLNRWYDPTVGRWLSEDPIGFSAGDANVYRYVGNFSTGAVDPSGLAPPGMFTRPLWEGGGGSGWISKEEADRLMEEAKRKQAQRLNGGGAWGGGWNPYNWRRWIYTGSPKSSDEFYDECIKGGGHGLDDIVIGGSLSGDIYLPYSVVPNAKVEVDILSIYVDPITGEYAGNFLEISGGVGAGAGCSANVEITFSNNASPKDVAFGRYDFVEVDTPIADVGWQGTDDYDAWKLGIGKGVGGGVVRGKGVGPGAGLGYSGDWWD